MIKKAIKISVIIIFCSILNAADLHAQPPAIPCLILAIAGPNGEISPSGKVQLLPGTSQTFIIKPNEGYHIKQLEVDKKVIEPMYSYTFENVESGSIHIINVTFEINTYTITTKYTGKGSIIPAESRLITHGESQKFEIIPAEHYHIYDVLINGKSVGPVPEYIIESVESDTTIHAIFEIDNYNIFIKGSNYGVILPETALSSGQYISPPPDEFEHLKVSYDGSVKLVIIPKTGYHVGEVVIDGKSMGKITEYTFSNVKSDHTISARFNINRYSIKAKAEKNGIITPSGEIFVPHGSDQKFIIIPNKNFRIANVIVDDVSVGAIEEFTFKNVTTDHTLLAVFEQNVHSIKASCGKFGNINPSGEIYVKHEADQTFKINPNIGYHVDDVIVDGKSIGAVSEYTFKKVVSDHTISAIFAINTYTIKTSTDGNGNIKPSGNVSVKHGSSQEFTFLPDEGYQVADITVDGKIMGNIVNYTFSNVTSDHSISATFKPNSYIIIARTEKHGIITPSGVIEVAYGSSQTFTIKADAGYRVSDVIVDGVSHGTLDTYTFSNVKSIHTISVKIIEGFLLGDVNGDGRIRSDDAIIALQMVVGLMNPTPQQLCAADMDNDGRVTSSDVIMIIRKSAELLAPANFPERFELMQNFPNPFNPETWIPYQISEPAEVIIRIYNNSGKLIRELDLGYKLPGVYKTRNEAAYWDGKDESGEYSASGVYFYSIHAGKFYATKKMVILR